MMDVETITITKEEHERLVEMNNRLAQLNVKLLVENGELKKEIHLKQDKISQLSKYINELNPNVQDKYGL